MKVEGLAVGCALNGSSYLEVLVGETVSGATGAAFTSSLISGWLELCID